MLFSRDVFMLPELKLMWEMVSLEVYTENDNLEIIVYPTKLSETGDDIGANSEIAKMLKMKS